MKASALAAGISSEVARHERAFSVVYLVYREMLSSIIPSQVITPLAEQNKSVPTEVVAHVAIGHLLRRRWRSQFRKVQDLCQSQRLKATWLAAPPPRTPWLWSDGRQLSRWLRRRFRKNERFILHCRGSKMTCLALNAARGFRHARVIYDARGDEIVETLETLRLTNSNSVEDAAKQEKTVESLRAREHMAVRTAHGVTAVSQSLLDTLQSRNGIDLKDRSLVIPCCPDIDAFTQWLPRRDEARRELGLADKFIVCYLGSLAWYQMPELSLRVFRLIRQLRGDAHFLAMTTQPEKMDHIIREQGIAEGDFTVRSFPQSEVPRWLVAADLGLMLRKQDAVNRAASPVKFGEYLAAGVPVVISQGLGDVSELVLRHQLGCVVDITSNDDEMLSHLRTGMPSSQGHRNEQGAHCLEAVRQSLCWNSLNSLRLSFYSKMLDETHSDL